MLAEFLYQAIHVTPGTPAPDRSVVKLPELRRYIEEFGRPDDICMVAKVETSDRPLIVGAAWARIFPNNAAGYGTIDTATPEISISLLPDWRDQGIGRRLMTALLNQLRTDGRTAASLSVQRTNANALHLYESLGFAIISEHDGELVMRAVLAD
ncbi:N-acetyltransferase family protein [Bifidobacterium dentium]